MPQQFRMLLKDGKGQPFPWTKTLATRKDMKEVMMTGDEIREGVPSLARIPKYQNPGIQAMLKARAEKRAKEKEENEEVEEVENAEKIEKAEAEVAEPEQEIVKESKPAIKAKAKVRARVKKKNGAVILTK